jgi:ribosome maturation factor RimP
MREDSQRGAPRSARAPGRPGAGRAGRTSGNPSRGQPAAYGTSREAGRIAGSPAPGRARQGQGASADTTRLTSVIEPVLAAMEIDLEAVKLSSAGRRVLLRVVIDADGGVSLDDIAEVSRELSARLDAKNAMGDAPYTLEVTSPGVDRPLTQHRHWRRAAGRLVTFECSGVEYLGRVIDAAEEGVTLDLDGERRTFRFEELGPGRVQVEFGRLDEIDEADEVDGADDLEAFHDAEDSWQGEGPDEEEPDGH